MPRADIVPDVRIGPAAEHTVPNLTNEATDNELASVDEPMIMTDPPIADAPTTLSRPLIAASPPVDTEVDRTALPVDDIVENAAEACTDSRLPIATGIVIDAAPCTNEAARVEISPPASILPVELRLPPTKAS